MHVTREPVIHTYDTVDSTNDIALQMARDGAPEGTAIIAQRQLKGRGRRGRKWLDEPGESVLMSVILRPPTPPDTFHELSFMASLALAEHLRSQYDIQACLKWPNDVLVNGRKVAGILLEMDPGSKAVVVGIGINVNQHEFAPHISATATSIMLETGCRHEVARAAKSLARAVLAEYEAYLASGFKEIRERWRKYMWGFGRQAEVRTEGGVIRGEIAGIDEAGALLIRDPSGTEHTIHAADAVNLVTHSQEAL